MGDNVRNRQRSPGGKRVAKLAAAEQRRDKLDIYSQNPHLAVVKSAQIGNLRHPRSLLNYLDSPVKSFRAYSRES